MSSKFFYPAPNGQWDLPNGNRFRNHLGRIASRGSSIAFATGIVGYSLDGWILVNATSGALTVTQSTDVPANSNLPFSLRATVTTADTSIAAGEASIIRQPIEGYDVQDLVSNDFFVAFWVRSAKTGVHGFSLYNSGIDRWFVSPFTVNTANTWELKVVPVPGGLSTGAGTWNFASGIGVVANWTLSSGTTFVTASTNSWQSGALAITTSSQVNCMDTVGNIFAIAGARLQRGLGAVQLADEFSPISADVARNARYLPVYQAYVASEDVAWGVTTSTSAGIVDFQFFTEPRLSPTGILVSAASDFFLGTAGAGSAATGLVFSNAGRRMVRMTATGTGTPYVAASPAVLIALNTNSRILFTGAEL